MLLAEVDENDDESEGEWEDGAQDLIANDLEMDHSARDYESRRRLDEFMNRVSRLHILSDNPYSPLLCSTLQRSHHNNNLVITPHEMR